MTVLPYDHSPTKLKYLKYSFWLRFKFSCHLFYHFDMQSFVSAQEIWNVTIKIAIYLFLLDQSSILIMLSNLKRKMQQRSLVFILYRY